ncbi:glycine betaine ABC transporter substrate-binding protein [Nocardia sp. NPDC020380]|uniref:glycine betaine ABC transporter substrate-binding protein n=1 Tax=Nocardia sp. NPDC020380 TaxID=3364309 RepID=UPI00378E461A
MFGRTDPFARTDRNVRRTGSAWSRRALSAVVLATVAVLSAACGSNSSGPVLAVGAGDTPQSDVLAEIYAQALARTGATAVVKTGMGNRKDLLAALDADTIVATGDVNGDLLTYLDPTATARKPDGDTPAVSVTRALNAALPEGLIVSDAADGTDLRPTVVALTTRTTEFPATLKDLAPRCEDLTFGISTAPALDAMHAPLDLDRDVRTPLDSVYGCKITHPITYTTDADLMKALSTGEVQLGVLSGPPSFLPDGGVDLTPVSDPDYAFRAANVLAVIRKGALTDTQLRKLDYVAGELTTPDLADMIHQIRDSHAIPSSVARTWLDDHGL